jgi:hypothetical protein
MTHPSEDPVALDGPHPHCRSCQGTGYYRSPTTNVRTPCNCPAWATRPLHGAREERAADIMLLRARVTALEDVVKRLVDLCTSRLNSMTLLLETPAKERRGDGSTT